MTYTHLTPNELVIIEAYFHQETPVAFVAKKLKRGRQANYNVYHFLKQWSPSKRWPTERNGFQSSQSGFHLHCGFKKKSYTQKITELPDTNGSLFELCK